jgi:hypothetical protein
LIYSARRSNTVSVYLSIFSCCLLAGLGRVRAAEPIHLYVVGDSTAAAYPSERYPLTGWAQVMQEHFDPQVVLVADEAKGGRSAKSFTEEGSWAKVLAELKKGDYVFKGLIDSQTAVEGWPELRSLPAPEDTDRDGMPDAWERAHKLSPSDASDGAQDANGDGYTNLEEYLN